MATFTNVTSNTLSLGVGVTALAPDATVDETEQDITGLTNIKYFYDLEYLELTDGTPDFSSLVVDKDTVSFLDMAVIDCSLSPNYPATSLPYRVSVDGLIGGVSGKPVFVNDLIVPILENAGGTQAAVGASWAIIRNALAGLWDDLRVPMTATKLGGTHDPGFTVFKTNGAGSQGVFLYWFDATSEEELYFSCQMPHSWNGSEVHPHVHWVPKTTADGTPANQTVKWGLEYTWASRGDVFGNTSIVYANTYIPADANVVAGKHYISEFTPLAAGESVSSMLICRVFRDATNDTYEQDAGLLEVDFHFQTDKAGSRQEYIA